MPVASETSSGASSSELLAVGCTAFPRALVAAGMLMNHDQNKVAGSKCGQRLEWRCTMLALLWARMFVWSVGTLVRHSHVPCCIFPIGARLHQLRPRTEALRCFTVRALVLHESAAPASWRFCYVSACLVGGTRALGALLSSSRRAVLTRSRCCFYSRRGWAQQLLVHPRMHKGLIVHGYMPDACARKASAYQA